MAVCDYTGSHGNGVDETAGERGGVGIRTPPIRWIYEVPFMMDGRQRVWFQGCSVLIGGASLAGDGILLEALGSEGGD